MIYAWPGATPGLNLTYVVHNSPKLGPRCGSERARKLLDERAFTSGELHVNGKTVSATHLVAELLLRRESTIVQMISRLSLLSPCFYTYICNYTVCLSLCLSVHTFSSDSSF